MSISGQLPSFGDNLLNYLVLKKNNNNPLEEGTSVSLTPPEQLHLPFKQIIAFNPAIQAFDHSVEQSPQLVISQKLEKCYQHIFENQCNELTSPFTFACAPLEQSDFSETALENIDDISMIAAKAAITEALKQIRKNNKFKIKFICSENQAYQLFQSVLKEATQELAITKEERACLGIFVGKITEQIADAVIVPVTNSHEPQALVKNINHTVLTAIKQWQSLPWQAQFDDELAQESIERLMKKEEGEIQELKQPTDVPENVIHFKGQIGKFTVIVKEKGQQLNKKGFEDLQLLSPSEKTKIVNLSVYGDNFSDENPAKSLKELLSKYTEHLTEAEKTKSETIIFTYFIFGPYSMIDYLFPTFLEAISLYEKENKNSSIKNIVLNISSGEFVEDLFKSTILERFN